MTNYLAGNLSIPNFDLSRNKPLRAIDFRASSLVHGNIAFLKHLLSTITSPVFSEFIIVYREDDLYCGAGFVYRPRLRSDGLYETP